MIAFLKIEYTRQYQLFVPYSLQSVRSEIFALEQIFCRTFLHHSFKFGVLSNVGVHLSVLRYYSGGGPQPRLLIFLNHGIRSRELL